MQHTALGSIYIVKTLQIGFVHFSASIHNTNWNQTEKSYLFTERERERETRVGGMGETCRKRMAADFDFCWPSNNEQQSAIEFCIICNWTYGYIDRQYAWHTHRSPVESRRRCIWTHRHEPKCYGLNIRWVSLFLETIGATSNTYQIVETSIQWAHWPTKFIIISLEQFR